MAVIPVYKPLGWTPLQVLDWLRENRPDDALQAMTHASPLDPVMEGLLLVLTEEDRRKKSDYVQVDKTYRSEIVFGAVTDSYNVLGFVESLQATDKIDPEEIRRGIENCVGERELPLPPFSSHKVGGAPLHFWARSGTMDRVVIPTRVMRVDKVTVLGMRIISRHELEADIVNRVNLVRGSFRQEETIRRWRAALGAAEGGFLAVQVRCHVGHGTCVRSLVHAFGRELGTGAFLLSFVRERAGAYSIDEALMIEDPEDAREFCRDPHKKV